MQAIVIWSCDVECIVLQVHTILVI